MKRYIFLSAIFLGYLLNLNASELHNANTRKYVGVFKSTDKTIPGIVYGNWGSRPYEYAWASTVVDIEGKRVIDLGVGLPSQYNWYEYIIYHLKPSFYAGIDFDGRIFAELTRGENYEIRHMDMANLEYPDKSFDIAYCISTFEHIPYEIFKQAIEEAHRVLEDDGLLVITLNEEWDKDQPLNHSNGWNILEQSLVEKGLFKKRGRSFGLPEFLDLIKDYFVLAIEDAARDSSGKNICSRNNHQTYYYRRMDKDFTILNSGLPTNSCVSYAVLKKVLKKKV
jgi:SAM-dependent methyltransferase